MDLVSAHPVFKMGYKKELTPQEIGLRKLSAYGCRRRQHRLTLAGSYGEGLDHRLSPRHQRD